MKSLKNYVNSTSYEPHCQIQPPRISNYFAKNFKSHLVDVATPIAPGRCVDTGGAPHLGQVCTWSLLRQVDLVLPVELLLLLLLVVGAGEGLAAQVQVLDAVSGGPPDALLVLLHRGTL
jgi:hypothetical protein